MAYHGPIFIRIERHYQPTQSCLIICFTIAALFISACRLSYADLEGIFLIAAHVSITHEKQCVGVGTG